ncbi:cobalt-precorrin 5A hydrolase [uncultured Clostridium sp.]|uniref:cobalt-precorrin 5A hydrolase n=1 Tax=uncultured Clostridium sp. TaxID=59620 RepID=UPI0025D6862B|nr:cobalt-precorrin 5A hydrolase [uncultured Clostridium sp.]
MISIICPSPKGMEIGLKLKKNLNADLYMKLKAKNIKSIEGEENLLPEENSDEVFQNNIYIYAENFNLKQVTEKAFKNSEGIIFISSTGIAVRAAAPFIESKDKDPGIVVVDLSAKYAVSLLSGHLGGGNELAEKTAQILNCEAVITTATDSMGIMAPDIIAKKYGLVIEDLKKAKYIASLLVEGKEVGLKDEYKIMRISKGYRKIEALKEDSVWITDKLKYDDSSSMKLDFSKILKLIKKDVVIGIGCRKNTPYEKIREFVLNTMKQYNYDIRAVNKIVSVDIKKNETGIIKLSESLECPFETFSRDEIRTVEDKYEKSEFVFKTLGIYSVCEPSVDLGGAEVIVSKIKHEGMTIAVGILR